MQTSENNPNSNHLGPGINDDDVISAITKSGFPLQTIVAQRLRRDFNVQDEWSYIDRDTKEIRTIDILASRVLYNFADKNHPRIRPTLNILIECKQSILPYVFFLSPNSPWLSEYPILSGLFKNSIILSTDDDASTYNDTIIQALGLNNHPFVIEGPRYSMTFSKCARKGSDLELSGTEAYQGLVLPLVKSMLHFQSAATPPPTAYYFDCHLTIPLAVLDAPMIGVDAENNNPILLPWIRVVRNESYEKEDQSERFKTYAIDVIHKDFLDTYLQEHLLPFANHFSDLALKHQTEIATGEGYATGLSKRWHPIEERLQPRELKIKAARGKVILSHIFQFLAGKK
jgi:hypothetical protein